MTYVSVLTDAVGLLSLEGAQAVFVIFFASLATRCTRYPIEVTAGD